MMNDKEQDDTWEDFFGSSPDLMPSIMGAIDAFLDSNKDPPTDTPPTTAKPASPKRVHQAGNFSHLSRNVQKILANVPDVEITTSTPDQKRFSRCNRSMKKTAHKSNESLDIISPNVQKILSNLPDTELVLPPDDNNSRFQCADKTDDDLQDSKSAAEGFKSVNDLLEDWLSNKPLGSYMQKSPSGIASRTPVGRKSMGKYLQIPSESTNSTLSSEVSRPVSLTSLGSCSSSGSSGLHQQGSAYLASAESLDSDVEPIGSQGSADSGIGEPTSISPELRVLQEVLDTESVYVGDLKQVIHGYLEPWRNDPECPLQPYLSHLFSNIEEIYDFNRSFLQDLQSGHCNPSQTANVFLHNDIGFSVYTEYCTNYPRTMNVLTELTRDDKMAALFRTQQIALGHALPLGSYLLKPVQRILKYHLLLQRLSKQCSLTHRPAVDLALTTMTSVATHINTMKRKHEHAVRVQEIQSQLYGWIGPDLTALGELIAEGTFRVGGARGRRHVFLFDKLLLMAKSKSDGALAYKTHIMCSNLMLVEQVRGEPLCFHVLPFDNPRNQCTLRARSTQHKREWTLQIKRVILENYSAAIPNHARQLVMQLGQEIEETPSEDQNEKWSPMKQHSTPQYLERRSRVRKTRDFTNRRTASQDRTFPSLGNWRRKSDPSGIQQYSIKVVPKKVSKIKKSKECGTIFYTDLSDSENCDAFGASIDSLNAIQENRSKTYEDIKESSLENQVKGSTIAQVVSDLLMQNEDFHKLINRRRRNIRDLENVPSVWTKQEERLPSKADSLPRSFQLSDQCEKKENEIGNLSVSESSTSLQEKLPENDDSQEIDISSQLEEDYPEHKIYRKSSIRFSLVQRFRAMLNEEQKKSKLPSYKQGSKSMGAKIANPDYADPQKLFTASQTNLALDNNNEKTDFDYYELPKTDIDMTINENEVLNEVDKRLSENSDEKFSLFKSSPNGKSVSLLDISPERKFTYVRCNSDIFSSQNSDSYYESLLDKSLHEEEKKIEKSDSFRSSTPIKLLKPEVKRPNKAPPPVPVKPKYLNKLNNNKSTNNSNMLINESINKTIISYASKIETCSNNDQFNQNSKGWVKTIVNRFE